MYSIGDVNNNPDLYIFLKSPLLNKTGQIDLALSSDIWIESRTHFCQRVEESLQESGITLWHESNLSTLLYEQLGLWDWEQLDLALVEHQSFARKYDHLSKNGMTAPLYQELGSEFRPVSNYAGPFDTAIHNTANVIAFGNVHQLVAFVDELNNPEIREKVSLFLEKLGY